VNLVNDKIDRLSELHIDRTQETESTSRWPYILVGTVVLVAAASLARFIFGNGAIEITTETVRSAGQDSAAASVLDGSGYVVARRQATVSSEVSGKVLEVLIEEGMIVEKGQVVASLDNSFQSAQLALAEAQLVSSQAQLSETQAQLTQAELDLNRTEELAARDLASDSELDAARANAQTLRARLQAGKENVTVARRRLDVSKDQLDKTTIRAPFAGVVVTKNAQPGEMISPNSAGGSFTRTGICTIVDMDSLEIEVDVNEAYIQRVAADQLVTATLDAYPDWKIPARVIAIVPTADRDRATVRVRIGFEALEARILPDMGVKVAFRDDQPEQVGRRVVAIPRDALRRDGGTDVVFVVTGDRVERRAVRLDASEGDIAQITAGVEGGERVVVQGPSDLVDGDEVEVTSP